MFSIAHYTTTTTWKLYSDYCWSSLCKHYFFEHFLFSWNYLEITNETLHSIAPLSRS